MQTECVWPYSLHKPIRGTTNHYKKRQLATMCVCAARFVASSENCVAFFAPTLFREWSSEAFATVKWHAVLIIVGLVPFFPLPFVFLCHFNSTIIRKPYGEEETSNIICNYEWNLYQIDSNHFT